MEQTDMMPSSNSNSDRRVDSSRRRAEAEEQARLQAEQVRQQDEQARRQDEPARWQAQPQEVAQPDATDPVWQRWRDIQSNFVDDPRSSVAEAHALVSGVVDRVVHQLEEQRSQLEQSWSGGSDTSTEDLRHGLQGYREFLARLLSDEKARG